MRWVEVSSSNVKLLGVDGQDLLVQFHGGETYRYWHAGSHFAAMRNAESVGRYLNSEIKPRYAFERTDGK